MTDAPSADDLAFWDVMEEELDSMRAVDEAERVQNDRTTPPPDVGFWLAKAIAAPLAPDAAYYDFEPLDSVEHSIRAFIHNRVEDKASAQLLELALSGLSAHQKQQLWRRIKNQYRFPPGEGSNPWAAAAAAVSAKRLQDNINAAVSAKRLQDNINNALRVAALDTLAPMPSRAWLDEAIKTLKPQRRK